MVVSVGEKVHVMMRRTFESQVRRHFAGEIVAVDGPVVRVTGYVFVYDEQKAQYVKKNSLRTTILNLAESGYIANMIPKEVKLDDLTYTIVNRKELVFTDGKTFTLNINEFGVRR